jgi:hypothetical protein
LINKKSIIFVLVLFMVLIPISLMGQNEQTSYLISAGADGEFDTQDDLYIAEGGDVKKGAAPVNLESIVLSAGAKKPATQNIQIPNVDIPEGEALVFKGDDYLCLTAEDLLIPLDLDLKVDELGRPDLIGGSLYVPASVGELVVDQWSEHINWDVYGHIILEPDILVNVWKPVNMVSHAGDVILNNTTIAGNAQHYQVNITAENGSIEANGTTINLRGAER